MSAKLLRVDKNGTKYWVDDVCPKCNGKGRIDYYGYYADGVCFMCGGTGTHTSKWKEMTPEHAQELADRRIKKAIKKSEETNRKFLAENGFNEEGFTWCITGDTYSIKDELKEMGGKFQYGLGWHFAEEKNIEGHETVMVSIDEVGSKNICNEYSLNEIREIKEVLKSKHQKTDEEEKSEYIGEVGEKINTEVELVKRSAYTVSSYSGYGTDIVHVYTFKDENGNQIVWKTGSYPEIEEGKSYTLTGKVKEHKEYKGIKQTYMKNCKFC